MGTSSIRISQSQITNKIHQIQLHPQQQPPIIMSSNDNTSSLQSVMDTATGYINSGIAAVTGSAGDQAKADQYKTKGEAESDLSHTAARKVNGIRPWAAPRKPSATSSAVPTSNNKAANRIFRVRARKPRVD